MPDPQNILFVNNFTGPTPGGGEIHLIHLLTGCIADGWRVSVATPRSSHLSVYARKAGFPVFFTNFDLHALPMSVVSIRRTLIASGANLIVGTGFLTNILVRLAARDQDVHVINIVHTHPLAPRLRGCTGLEMALRWTLERASRSAVHAYVAVAPSIRRALESNGANRERVHLIPNGVDIDALHKEASATDWSGPDGDGPLVGFVGRLTRIKGADIFIDMARRLSSEFNDLRFVMAGTGPQEHHLRSLAKQNRLEQRLSFLGHVSPSAPVIAACDALVIPSRSEGLPLVAAEAMALKTPVVCFGVGGLPDMIQDEQTGLLVPPQDTPGLAAAVARLLRDPEFARKLAEHGLRHVSGLYSMDDMIQAYLDLFTNLAGEPLGHVTSG